MTARRYWLTVSILSAALCVQGLLFWSASQPRHAATYILPTYSDALQPVDPWACYDDDYALTEQPSMPCNFLDGAL